MDIIIEGQSCTERPGWWQANIYLSSTDKLTQEDYEKYFDTDVVSFNTVKSILENNEETYESFPARYLKSDCRKEIRNAILDNGEQYTILDDFTLMPNWGYSFHASSIDGEEIDWYDIDGRSQEHIADCIVNDNCVQGDLCVTKYFIYSIDTEDITVDDGIYEGIITVNDMECDFRYIEKDNEIKIETPYDLYDMWNNIPISSDDLSYHCKEITSAIKTACEYIEEELPSLDEKIASAESKTKNIFDTKNEKTKDVFER